MAGITVTTDTTCTTATANRLSLDAVCSHCHSATVPHAISKSVTASTSIAADFNPLILYNAAISTTATVTTSSRGCYTLYRQLICQEALNCYACCSGFATLPGIGVRNTILKNIGIIIPASITASTAGSRTADRLGRQLHAAILDSQSYTCSVAAVSTVTVLISITMAVICIRLEGLGYAAKTTIPPGSCQGQVCKAYAINTAASSHQAISFGRAAHSSQTGLAISRTTIAALTTCTGDHNIICYFYCCLLAAQNKTLNRGSTGCSSIATVIILALLTNIAIIPGITGLYSQADTGRCQAAISYGYTSRRITSCATITHSHFRSRSRTTSITTTFTTVTCLCCQRQIPRLHIAPNRQLQLCVTTTAAITSYSISLSTLSAAVTAITAGIISTAAGSTVCTIITNPTKVSAGRDTDIFPDIIGAVSSVGCRPGCTSPQVQAAGRYDRHGQ